MWSPLFNSQVFEDFLAYIKKKDKAQVNKTQTKTTKKPIPHQKETQTTRIENKIFQNCSFPGKINP